MSPTLALVLLNTKDSHVPFDLNFAIMGFFKNVEAVYSPHGDFLTPLEVPGKAMRLGGVAQQQKYLKQQIELSTFWPQASPVVIAYTANMPNHFIPTLLGVR